MRPGLFEFGGQLGVIFEIVFRARRIEDVARIADRRLAEFVLLTHGVHRHPHVLHPVQAVEDTEQVDAAGGCLTDIILHHVVGVVLVSHAVGAA